MSLFNMTNEPKITPDDIRELLAAVQQDRDGRKVFLAMPREEQLMAILGMLAYNSSRLAQVEKNVIAVQGDLGTLQKEQRTYRRSREKVERELAEKLDVHFEHGEDAGMNTTEKVKAVIASQYGGVAKFFVTIFQGVLQTVITIITLALLYLAFGGSLPTP